MFLVLGGLNQIKQFEYKTFAPLSLTIPLIFNFIREVRQQPEDNTLAQKVTQTIKKQFLSPQFVSLSIMTLIALAKPLYAERLGLVTKGGFDASGHSMLKTVLSMGMGMVLGKTTLTNPIFATMYATAYAATDALFLYNTAYFCHTVSETLAGAAWAGSILILGVESSKLFFKN